MFLYCLYVLVICLIRGFGCKQCEQAAKRWVNEADVIRAFRESVQDGTDKAEGALAKRELDVQPILRVRPGWPLAVLVHRDLLLRPWQNQPET